MSNKESSKRVTGLEQHSADGNRQFIVAVEKALGPIEPASDQWRRNFVSSLRAAGAGLQDSEPHSGPSEKEQSR